MSNPMDRAYIVFAIIMGFGMAMSWLAIARYEDSRAKRSSPEKSSRPATESTGGTTDA